MCDSWRSWVSHAAPRVIALLWAAFTLTRALAYTHGAPPQLVDVAIILPVPLWVVWGIAAVLLGLGGLVPPRAGAGSQKAARLMRQWGLTVAASLLLMWAASFLLSDSERGWVSAANYLMLAFFAGWSGWIASREVASVRAVNEERGVGGVAGLDE